MRIGLVIPALDEEEALPLVLEELPKELLARLVVVDNGSTDRTAELAAAGGAEVVREDRRGYGRACLTGLELLFRDSEAGEALESKDVIAFIDADHSDYAEELPLVLAPIQEGRADLVIGSRVLGGADMQALLPQAWFGNRLACFLMRILFGAHYTDLGPFRAIRVDALRRLEMHDEDFGWTVEMQLKAKTFGLRVVEVPVRYRARIGKSKITGTILGTVRAGWKILGWIGLWRMRLWFKPRPQ
ncbi:MAG: glycosyltransferase involved in cell wall biosynthesis [Planctomycetota bacterium]|jgi:glycosyltransferase involved in cell wall biosynthesis